MKAKIILVALALFLGAIGYTVQAQCSADCQCGKTTEDKTLAVGNRKVADFSMIRLEAVGDIFFTQSDRCSVRIEGPQEYVSKTTTVVKNGVLVIGYQKNNNNSNNIIELKNIVKTYDNGFTAVDGFNLEVKRGEFVTFLGPSGCGKTTTLRMIAGFEIPTSGEILLNGQDISKLPPNKRPINTVFQRYALFPHLNIFDNIAFGLKLKKLPKAEIVKKVKKVLEMVDLEGFEDRKVATLSGGQQQRIAIARALVNEPEILLLDEPLGALDLKMRKEMQIELKGMHDRLGITFIYVTHDQEEALTMSDKIVVMSEGEIQQIGTPEDIYNEPIVIIVIRAIIMLK